MSLADEIVAKNLKETLPEFEEGDTVDVHVQIREGDKTRVQVFTGTVISIRGTGIRRNFTVRRIVQGEGVERTFPIHAPTVVDVKVKKKGKVRRAKLYYLRDRVGKGTRVKERVWTGGKKKAAPSKNAKEKDAPPPSD
jgi:large subunit ribosomal protein L19